MSHVAMSATNAVLVQTNALNVQLHQNYLQDSVFVKIVSTKIRALAKLVDLLVPPVWMVTNVKHAPAGSSLVTLYASPVHSINTLLGMNVLCVARAAPSAKPVPVIAFNVQRTLSLSLELALAVIHSFSTKTVRCARRVKLPVLLAMIQVLARHVLLSSLLETPNACSVQVTNSFKEMNVSSVTLIVQNARGQANAVSVQTVLSFKVTDLAPVKLRSSSM